MTFLVFTLGICPPFQSLLTSSSQLVWALYSTTFSAPVTSCPQTGLVNNKIFPLFFWYNELNLSRLHNSIARQGRRPIPLCLVEGRVTCKDEFKTKIDLWPYLACWQLTMVCQRWSVAALFRHCHLCHWRNLCSSAHRKPDEISKGKDAFCLPLELKISMIMSF